MSAVRSPKLPARVRACALILVAASACNAQDPSRGIDQEPVGEAFDWNGYVCDAMPVLVRRCASLACHGSPQHALRIYAPGKLRAGDITDRDAREAPLTLAELDGNFASSTGVLRAAHADQRHALELDVLPLLRAPLSRAFGGDSHHDLAIFPVFPAATPADDPEWTSLARWVAGDRQPSPPSSSCQAFFAALGAAPR